ncbi:MAG: hypothetical protein U9R15_03935 [Chloroflexota bacterium]|nr:hypothetical protein [Chloroflexota bacterium]
MFAQRATIDQDGRITLPQQILGVLGMSTPRETKVVIEVTNVGVVIKPERLTTPITARIAAMHLPVADWNQTKQEIE